jgi:arginyl-tRNA synthetase
MNTEAHLENSVKEALKSLFETEIDPKQIKIELTNPDFEGDFTVLVFPFVRFSKKSPEETADMLGQELRKSNPWIINHNVIKGFLNLSLSHSYWLDWLKNVDLSTIGKAENKPAEKVIVEYSSPNTNKPLHLGHIRNNLLGYSVSELLQFYGYDTKKVNLVNDRGIHICKSMLAYQRFGNDETPESAGVKGDHLIGKYYVVFDLEYKKEIQSLIDAGLSEDDAKKQAPLILEAQAMLQKWEANETETVALWKKLNEWVYAGFNETYTTLGVSFDKFYYESETYLLGKDIVQEGLSKGLFYKKEDDSVWIDLEKEKLDHKLLQRGDGTSVYMTQDMGTADLKYKDFGCDKSIIVVGNEQDYHFKVLFSIMDKLGRPYAKGNYHLSYGMVDLPSGKMKSREGTVVDADDLMAEMIADAKEKTETLGKTDGMSEAEKNQLYYDIGMAALKYFILKVDPSKRMLFDPKESIDLQGDTGPFIQYSYTRIRSILRQAENSEVHTDQALETSERNLVLLLSQFGNVVKKGVDQYSPALVANYIYELARSFNKLYAEVPLLKEMDEAKKANRMAFCTLTAHVLKSGLGILGINAPERM